MKDRPSREDMDYRGFLEPMGFRKVSEYLEYRQYDDNDDETE